MQLSHTSILPFFIIMAIVTLFGAALVKFIPFYKREVEIEGSNRYETLDGLRGFLAFGVFFQHAVTNFAFFATGVWEITPERFYRHLGGESVILFFIITSFLYWSKAIAKKGNLDIMNLYRSRFLRLSPMYLVSAAIVTLAALIETRFSFVSIGTSIRDILSWLTMGLYTTTTVNGDSIIPINAGIHWTLHFEWIFYLFLPISALALRSFEARLMLVPILAFAFTSPERGYWMIFMFGIAAAHIVDRFPRWELAKRSWMGVAPILGLILIYLIQYKPYSFVQYCVSLGVFLLFIYGNDLFGLLKTKAAKFLGTLSYSIYLMHGIVLYAVLHIANYFSPISQTTPQQFWSLILFSALVTVGVSTITYRYVEYPFLKMIQKRKAVDIEEKVM